MLTRRTFFKGLLSATALTAVAPAVPLRAPPADHAQIIALIESRWAELKKKYVADMTEILYGGSTGGSMSDASRRVGLAAFIEANENDLEVRPTRRDRWSWQPLKRTRTT